MEWRDTGFVLNARRHGESGLIVELLTAEHGRHAGLVRGGQSPRRRALLQPGNAIAAVWRGRLPEHLGTLDCELVAAHAARLLDDPDRLAALDSPGLWMPAYVAWECGLLAALGFGLDLARCAVTGTNEDLVYVSPRSG